MQKVR
jgi:amidase